MILLKKIQSLIFFLLFDFKCSINIKTENLDIHKSSSQWLSTALILYSEIMWICVSLSRICGSFEVFWSIFRNGCWKFDFLAFLLLLGPVCRLTQGPVPVSSNFNIARCHLPYPWYVGYTLWYPRCKVGVV